MSMWTPADTATAMVAVALICFGLSGSCAALQSPAAKTAYDTVLPYAKDAITRYFESKGEEPVIESGGCFAEPIIVDDEDGLTWFVCAATGTAPE